jgi:hypothetical protein
MSEFRSNPFDGMSSIRDPFDGTSLRSSQFGSVRQASQASLSTRSDFNSSTSDNISIRSNDEPVNVDVRSKPLKDTPHNNYMRNYMRDYMRERRKREKYEREHPKPQLIALHSDLVTDPKIRRKDEVENVLSASFKNLVEVVGKLYDLYTRNNMDCTEYLVLAEKLKHTDILEAIDEISKFLMNVLVH